MTDYYKNEDGVDVIETIIEEHGPDSAIHFCLGNVDKYLARAGKKPGESELSDLRKAYVYLDRVSGIASDRGLNARRIQAHLICLAERLLDAAERRDRHVRDLQMMLADKAADAGDAHAPVDIVDTTKQLLDTAYAAESKPDIETRVRRALFRYGGEGIIESWNYAAVDMDGSLWVFSDEPVIVGDSWMLHEDCRDGQYRHASGLEIDGDEWKESLVKL